MANPVTVEVDKELYDGLQQARKRKPRYFAVIAKGADCVGMIVQKKVITDSQIQKKKSQCDGKLVIQGICVGEGVELKLEVLGAEPSLQPKKVKDFIDEQTELSLKPWWSVVTKLSDVPDDEAKPAAGTTAGDPLAEFQAKSQAAYAALGQMKPTNPFRDGLNTRLQMEIALVGNVPANVPNGLKTLATLEQETKTAETFGTRATDIFFTIEKLNEQDPLRGQLMYSWNAEITSARNAGATPAQYVPAALQRLATLEQMAKAKLPAETAQPEAKQEPVKDPAKTEPAKEPAAKVDVKALQERLKGLLTRQKALFALDAAWREKMLPYSQPATSSVMSASPAAPEALDNLEKALTAAESGKPLPPVAKKAEPTAPKSDTGSKDLAAEWAKKVADWTPLIKEAIAANGPMSADIKKALAQASASSKPGGDMAEALARLTEAHELAQLATRVGDSQHQKWMAELARVEPQYLEALKSGTGDVSKLRAVMAYCAEQAENEAYDKALAGLKRLEALLNPPPTDKPAETKEPEAKQPETKQPEAKEPESKPSEGKPSEKAETGAQVEAKELTADDLRKQLADLRMELEKRVGDAEPNQLSQVMALQEQAGPLDKEASTNIEANKLKEAAASIEALRTLLGGKSQAEPAAKSAPTADPQAAEPNKAEPKATETKEASADDLRKQLADLRMELEKRVGDAELDQLSQVMALQEQAGPLVKEAFANLEASKLAEAVASIGALRNLLDGKGAAEPTASGSGKFETLKTRLEPELLKAQKANPDAATSLSGLWLHAVELADADNEEKAGPAFERLEKAIAEALAKAPQTDVERFGTTAGLVAEHRKELEKFFAARFATAEASTAGLVSSVEKAIEQQVPDEDPKFLASAVQNALDEKYEEVRTALEEPLAKEGTTKEEMTALVEKLRKDLAGDELLAALKRAKSELGVDADASADFESLLDDVLSEVKG